MEQDFKCCSLQFSIIVYLQCRDNSLKLSKSNLLYFVKISCQKGDGYFFKVISLQYTELLIIDVKIKCLPLVFVSILVFVFVFVFYCLFIVNGHSISVIYTTLPLLYINSSFSILSKSASRAVFVFSIVFVFVFYRFFIVNGHSISVIYTTLPLLYTNSSFSKLSKSASRAVFVVFFGPISRIVQLCGDICHLYIYWKYITGLSLLNIIPLKFCWCKKFQTLVLEE